MQDIKVEVYRTTEEFLSPSRPEPFHAHPDTSSLLSRGAIIDPEQVYIYVFLVNQNTMANVVTHSLAHFNRCGLLYCTICFLMISPCGKV